MYRRHIFTVQRNNLCTHTLKKSKHHKKQTLRVIAYIHRQIITSTVFQNLKVFLIYIYISCVYLRVRFDR